MIRTWTLVASFAALASAPAQDRIRPPGADDAPQAALARALDEGSSLDPAAFVREMQEAIESAGETFTSRDGRTWVPARDVYVEAILALGPEGVRAWRDRYGAEARKHFAAAGATDDPLALAAVRWRWFPSPAAAEAIDRLADLRMARGDFAAASILLAELDPAAHARGLRHPDPGVPLPRVLERLAECHRRLGDLAALRRTLDRLAPLDPLAAARSGPAEAAVVEPARPEEERRLRTRWILPPGRVDREWRRFTLADLLEGLFLEPIVEDRWILATLRNELRAVDAETGRDFWSGIESRFAPSARGEVVYAVERQGTDTIVIARRIDTGVRIRSSEPVHALGDPVLQGDRLLLPLDWGGASFLGCLRTEDLSLEWRVSIPERPSRSGAVRVAVAGGTAFWMADLGGIAAVDVVERRLLWITTYARGGENVRGEDQDDLPERWGPSPPIPWGPYLLATPVESASLLCLESATGRELWRRPRGPHHLLLGCMDGLVLTGVPGIAAWRIDAGGELAWENRSVSAFGLPASTGGRIFVPGFSDLEAGVYQLDPRDGRTIEFDPVQGLDLPAALTARSGFVLAAGRDQLACLARDPNAEEAEARARGEAERAGELARLTAARVEAFRLALERARTSRRVEDFDAALELASTGTERLETSIGRLEVEVAGRPFAEALDGYATFLQEHGRDSPPASEACRAAFSRLLVAGGWDESEVERSCRDQTTHVRAEGLSDGAFARLLLLPEERLPPDVRLALARRLAQERRGGEAIPRLRRLCELEGPEGSPARTLAAEALDLYLEMVAGD